jgi:hypothetical protein
MFMQSFGKKKVFYIGIEIKTKLFLCKGIKKYNPNLTFFVLAQMAPSTIYYILKTQYGGLK